MPIYTPQNKGDLIRLIINEMTEKGNECDLNHIDISLIKDLSLVFSLSYTKDFNGDISKWKTSQVVSMNNLFDESKFNGDISQWDTSQVETMKNLFAKSIFNGDISKWDVSNVTDMTGLFSRAEFNSDISQWKVGSVIDMNSMFEQSKFTGDISKWDVSNVINMSFMFSGSLFDGDISQWNVEKVENMNHMFMYADELNSDLNRWNPISVMHVANTFDDTSAIIPYWYDSDPKIIKELLMNNKEKIKLNDKLNHDLSEQETKFGFKI